VGYEVLLLVSVAVLASPLLAWIHLRRDRWRRPRLAMQLVLGAAALVVFGLSASYGYFYPYGHPGAELPGLRAVGDACWSAYAGARTAADSAAVDRLHPIADARDPSSVLSCGAARRNRILGCRPTTRCGRIKSWLRLPRADADRAA